MTEKLYLGFQKSGEPNANGDTPLVMCEVALVKTPTDRYGMTIKKAKLYIGFNHNEKEILADNIDPAQIHEVLQSNFISYI